MRMCVEVCCRGGRKLNIALSNEEKEAISAEWKRVDGRTLVFDPDPRVKDHILTVAVHANDIKDTADIDKLEYVMEKVLGEMSPLILARLRVLWARI